MDAQRLFEVWAPPESVWSRWAKPVLFASPSAPPWQEPGWSVEAPGPGPTGHLDPGAAYVIDLPGAAAVERGLALAHAGYRPVPLYNTAHHPAAVVATEPILARLAVGAGELAALAIPPAAPPAFLLDSRRLWPHVAPEPGRFDNRWMVFPQDFPSASFLAARGVRRVVLVQEVPAPAIPGIPGIPWLGSEQPQADLAHVLLRYAQGGLELFLQPADLSADLSALPRPLQVQKPGGFRSIFYRAIALAGLRRGSAGGFGAVIPVATSHTGFG